MAMESMLDYWNFFRTWFIEQPFFIQLLTGFALISVAYFISIVVRILWVALYAAFRGL